MSNYPGMSYKKVGGLTSAIFIICFYLYMYIKTRACHHSYRYIVSYLFWKLIKFACKSIACLTKKEGLWLIFRNSNAVTMEHASYMHVVQSLYFLNPKFQASD